MTDYAAAVAALDRLEAFGIRLGLENMEAACEALGRPERAFPSVHVAGTNGKGTTAAAVAALARAHGLSTGLYTSPHVVDFRERIVIDGEPVAGAAVARAWDRIREVVEARSMTYFEAATLMALVVFAERGVDLGVLEVGLGGRLDATNVVEPELAVVTNVARDHERHLGEDEASIAREKAGIFKPGVAALVGDAGPPEVGRVFAAVAGTAGAPLEVLSDGVEWTVREVGRERTVFDYASPDLAVDGLVAPLGGEVFAADAALGIRAFERVAPGLGVEIDAEAVRRGIERVALPGRSEWHEIDGVPVVFDVAHNPAAVGRLAETLRALGPDPSAFVVGILADKAWTAMLDALEPAAARAWLCGLETARPERRLTEPVAAAGVAARHWVEWADDVTTGLAAARAAVAAGEAGRIAVTGSFHTVGEALVALGLARPGEPHRRTAPAGVRG